MEELQSDWHQEGRKRGYATGDATPQATVLKANQGARLFYLYNFDGDLLGKFPTREEATEKAVSLGYEPVNEVLPNKLNKLVPDAPFKSSWHELTLKRMLRYAAENGYDKLALIDGEETAKRYDLSKQVENLMYQKREDGSYKIRVFKKGNRSGDPDTTIFPESDKALEQHVGKDVATRIIENQGETVRHTGYKSLEGLDLKVGGEWAFNLYDRMIPQFLKKYGKKFGAKVEDVEISIPDFVKPENFKAIDITPQMRGEEGVLGGQVRFMPGEKSRSAKVKDIEAEVNRTVESEKNKIKVTKLSEDDFDPDDMYSESFDVVANGIDVSASINKNKESGLYDVFYSKFGEQAGERDTAKSYEEALRYAKEEIALEVEDYHSDIVNRYRKGELIDDISLPDGWEVDEVIDSSGGSIYYKLREDVEYDADGDLIDYNEYKVRIADHDPSVFREKEFGANDFNVEVEDSSARELSRAIGEVEKWAQRKSRQSGEQPKFMPGIERVANNEPGLAAETVKIKPGALDGVRFMPGTKVPKITLEKIVESDPFIITADSMADMTYTVPDSGVEIKLHGGPMFSYRPGRAVWASNKGAASRIGNFVDRTGQRFALIMLQNGTNHAKNKSMGQVFVEELKARSGAKKIKQGDLKKMLKFASDRAGLEKPIKNLAELEDFYAFWDWDTRGNFFQTFGLVRTPIGDPKKAGFFDYNQIVRDTTQPEFLDKPTGTIVGAIEFKSGKRFSAEELGAEPHSSYDTMLEGRGVGLFKNPPHISDVLDAPESQRSVFTLQKRLSSPNRLREAADAEKKLNAIRKHRNKNAVRNTKKAQ